MSSSNKKSKTKTIATDSKPNQNQKNGIEKFVKKLPNTAPNTNVESGARNSLRNEGNVKVNENETNTLPNQSII